MSNSKFRATFLTSVVAILNVFILSIFNLIYNKFIILNYGSSVNGLISTFTQFVSVFTIMEGGFSVAAVVASFEPIANRDYAKLNNILYTVSKYLNKIGLLFVLTTFFCGTIYIFFIDIDLSFFKAFSLLSLTILSAVTSLIFISKYSIVISGYNKGYIVSCFSILSKTLTWIVSMILILNNCDIIFIYSMNFFNYLLCVLLLKKYEKKSYPFVTYKGEYSIDSIKGTKDIMFQKIASTVFSSTDLILISAGIGLASSSVYYLYNQIFHAIFNFIGSIIQSPFNSFGQLFGSKELKKINEVFSIFSKVTVILSSIFLIVTSILIIPFVRIYSKNIVDINYIIPSLVVMFYSLFYFQLNNRPYGILLNSSGAFKAQNIQCVISVIVNILFSLIFMKFWGISGVVFGSVVGTIIILFMNIFCCRKFVFNFSVLKHIVILLSNYFVGLVIIIISLILRFSFANYFILLLFASICFIIVPLLVCVLNIIIDFNSTLNSFKYFLSKINK